MPEVIHKLSDVYGISRDVPLNYVPRDTVDGALVASLTRDKHLVIFGSSKQGKTCLRKWNLKEEEYIVVTSSNKWSLADLHAAILKQAGYTIEQTVARTMSGGHKIAATAQVKGKLGPVEAGGSIGGDRSNTHTTQVTKVALELDPADVNDIIRALKEVTFHGFIVLEDFHYLSEETQRDFAVALKAFHEASPYCFIVIGVWLDENRLIQHNGDLAGRVIAVNADAWSEDELTEVIAAGEALLNVEFDQQFQADLIAGCFDSVYVVQEACYLACERAGVIQTSDRRTVVGVDDDAWALIREVVEADSARYNSFILNFAEGFMATELEMYRYLLVPVLLASSEQLEKGLLYGDLRKKISKFHPHGTKLNPGNITQALQSTASLQVAKLKIKPIVLDYDQSNRRLNVVDRGFLIWLKYQDRRDLLASIGIELSDDQTSSLLE